MTDVYLTSVQTLQRGHIYSLSFLFAFMIDVLIQLEILEKKWKSFMGQ